MVALGASQICHDGPGQVGRSHQSHPSVGGRPEEDLQQQQGGGRGGRQQRGHPHQVNTRQHLHSAGREGGRGSHHPVWSLIFLVFCWGLPASRESQVSGEGPGPHQRTHFCQNCLKAGFYLFVFLNQTVNGLVTATTDWRWSCSHSIKSLIFYMTEIQTDYIFYKNK